MTGIEINNYVTKSMNLAELLNKKKLVVTGANGFIGRALVDALVNTGARVTVCSIWPTTCGLQKRIIWQPLKRF